MASCLIRLRVNVAYAIERNAYADAAIG